MAVPCQWLWFAWFVKSTEERSLSGTLSRLPDEPDLSEEENERVIGDKTGFYNMTRRKHETPCSPARRLESPRPHMSDKDELKRRIHMYQLFYAKWSEFLLRTLAQRANSAPFCSLTYMEAH
jgi:hypothetical protein